MMRLITFISFFVLILTSTQIAGNEANYDLAARFSENNVRKLTGSKEVIPLWFKNSDRFWYIYSTPEEKKYYMVDPKKNEKKEIFNNASMAARLTEIVKNPYDASNLPISRLMLEGDSVFTFHVTTPQPGVGVKVS